MTARGVLLDIEGVVIEEARPVTGAAGAVGELGKRGIAVRYLTNTTTRPRRDIAEMLGKAGLDVAEEQVLTPASGAAGVLRGAGIRRVHLAAPSALRPDFAAFELVDTDPGAVVLGDLHLGFDWARLNTLFRMLRDGALLIALHRNRYCRREGELALDLGPFVAALEYAAGIEATVVGKPSRAFFDDAVTSLGVGRPGVVMVGDDIEADIGGALEAGLRAVQVRTGKWSESDEQPSKPQPTARIGSIVDLPGWLDGEG